MPSPMGALQDIKDTRIASQRTNTIRSSALEDVEASSESDSLNSFKLVNEFYDANLASRSKDSLRENSEAVINSFSDSAKIVCKGLQVLGQLHPFIGVVVNAFVLVITLDLARRDNDRKVIAVKLKMQDLMMVFFELRQYNNSEECGHDGITIGQRLQDLMGIVTDDIKKCGAACDAYARKRPLAKVIQATLYESRLAQFAETFMEHQDKLKMAFVLHTAVGVDAANAKLNHHTQLLHDMSKKLDMIGLFHQLETPRGRDTRRFIEEHGGIQSCLNDDELLEELVIKSGESPSRIAGSETSRKTSDLHGIRKKLFRELMEDIDDVFSGNVTRFEKKLDMYEKQLHEAISSESAHVISSVLAGAHDRILDADLQNIWRDMGWKGSVKARHFVLALHDYYTDQLSQVEGASTPNLGRISAIKSSRPKHVRTQSLMLKRQEDSWALAYINAAYVQPILEAVDDDGTGFVSVKEVNTFVSTRPEGWTLPQWIAYWAVGWQASISIYKGKIYHLVQSMFQTLEHVLPSNRHSVDEYLFHESFWRIELLLRSTRSVNPKIVSDPDLMRITKSYDVSEEERLEQRLLDVAYELDCPATVALVTGEGRIERFAFPLIYLLLRRHLQVITLACKHVLDPEELPSLNESLISVLLSAIQRIENLEAIFKQTHLDVQARFGNFAFGMFHLSCGDVKRAPISNSFGSWKQTGEDHTTSEALTKESIQNKLDQISQSILKYGIQDSFHSTDYYEFEPERLQKTSHPIQGTWTGYCGRTEGTETITYIIRLSFRLAEDRKTLLGKGEDFSSTFELEGQVKRGVKGYEFSFSVLDDIHGRRAAGVLDSMTDTITIGWTKKRMQESPDDPFYKEFQLRRTPPSLLRYRYAERQFAEDPVRSRWTFACNAALHQAQERLWSRRFFEARFSERKRFVELSTRNLIVIMGLSPQQPLNATEMGELEYLKRDLNPAEARFYHALSKFEIQKLPWHPAWGCDSCGRKITKSKIMCLQCMSDDLSDNIEVCGVCMDKTPAKRGFTHEHSHDVMKVEETLHDFHLAKVVAAAKARVGQAKSILKTLEMKSKGGGNARMPILSETDHELVSCACCSKAMSFPCWICVVCPKDVFICLDCDHRRIPPPSNSPHTPNHPLVRVRDAPVIGPDALADERNFALQQRFISLEHTITTRLSAMDAKVEDRLTALESRVEKRLTDFETRFDALEVLLKQLVAQTAAFSSIRAQSPKNRMQNSMPPTPISPY